MHRIVIAQVVLLTSCAVAGESRVDTTQALRAALASAAPGDRILIAPGDYHDGLYLEELHGDAERPIVIAAADPTHPPRFLGPRGVQFTEVAHLILDGLVFSGSISNGLNIDDGGTPETPSHHLTLRNLVVTDVGPDGNRDGIKLSGIEDFVIEDCRLERWGGGGSGIDLVGCHRGVIRRTRFEQVDGRGSNAIQGKGGTSEITVRECVFVNAGQRAINLGGSTGRPYFRPLAATFEAKDLTVEGNLFLGGVAPVAFVGVDGAVVRFNTIIEPEKWALRILQETREAGFVPSRDGKFTDNIIVFRSDRWTEGGVNIGPGTAPETFEFARNLWYCLDRPERSRPTLPTAETDGVYGLEPGFVALEQGDYRLREGAAGQGKGHLALPE